MGVSNSNTLVTLAKERDGENKVTLQRHQKYTVDDKDGLLLRNNQQKAHPRFAWLLLMAMNSNLSRKYCRLPSQTNTFLCPPILLTSDFDAIWQGAIFLSRRFKLDYVTLRSINPLNSGLPGSSHCQVKSSGVSN